MGRGSHEKKRRGRRKKKGINGLPRSKKLMPESKCGTVVEKRVESGGGMAEKAT